jgi:hypothetical protein
VRRSALLLFLVLLPSCTDGNVPLSHELEAGRRFEHRLTLTAEITRTLAGNERDQRIVAAFRITQEVTDPATSVPTAPAPAPSPPATEPTTSPAAPVGTPSPGSQGPGIGLGGLPGLGGGQSPSPQTSPGESTPPSQPSPAPPASPAGTPASGLPGLPLGGSPAGPPPAAQPVTIPVAEARVILTPESLEVDGRPIEVGPVQEFTVQLGSDGRVVSILEAQASQVALQPVGLERLLPRLRPVLPGGPVAPGDSWRSETLFQDEQGRFSVSATSRLAQLGVTDGYESALVRTIYRSPVRRQETFANAVADVTGEDVGAQEAWFALDGFLVRSSSDSVGTYDVTFRPAAGDPGVQPVQGALVVRLHTDMQLVSAG